MNTIVEDLQALSAKRIKEMQQTYTKLKEEQERISEAFHMLSIEVARTMNYLREKNIPNRRKNHPNGSELFYRNSHGTPKSMEIGSQMYNDDTRSTLLSITHKTTNNSFSIFKHGKTYEGYPLTEAVLEFKRSFIDLVDEYFDLSGGLENALYEDS